MSNEEMVHWRNLLEKRRQLILQTEETIKRQDLGDLSFEAVGELNKIKTHPADLATDTQEIEVLESLSEKNVKGLQEVEEAIDRLNRGEYGQCLSCNEPIAKKRLEALPEARYCIECEQDFEDQQKQFGPEHFPASTFQHIKEMSHSLEVLSQVRVADIMQRKPITLRLGEGLNQASALMLEHNIRHLPVVDPKGDIQGILSDRDILNAVLKKRPWKLIDKVENPWQEIKVSAIMTKVPESVSPDTTLREAGNLLLENKISCLPVVNGNRLVGIITEADYVKLVCQGS